MPLPPQRHFGQLSKGDKAMLESAAFKLSPLFFNETIDLE